MADRDEIDARILNNRGIELLQFGSVHAAIDSFKTALRLAPTYIRPLANLGFALREAGRADEALVYLNKALELAPEYLPALVNLGDALADQQAWNESIAVLSKAIRLAPERIEPRVSLGVTLARANRTEESIDALHHAIALSPQHAEAHCALGHVLYSTGEWAAAWPHMEYRFHTRIRPVPIRVPAGLAPWDRRPLPGLKLWVVSEQGLGDTLQFARYLPVLTQTHLEPVLVCDPRLVRLLSMSKLGPTIVPWTDTVHDPEARFIPLMSLPAALSTTADTVPTPGRYLSIDPARERSWHARLGHRTALRIGIAWQGNPSAERGFAAGRSPPLAAFEGIAALPGICLVSLQSGHGSEQIATVNFQSQIMVLERSESDHAFLDTAAVILNLDLVITSDTAVAHLAAALGKRTWLCLSSKPDWRWMQHGDTTPWYQSMTIFRQQRPGDWIELFERVRAALQRLILTQQLEQ